MKSDLHIHTYYSDGVFSPEKIVDTALDVGLEVIALTDHDNVLSYDVAKNHLKEVGAEDKLEIIQGVEINTLYKNYTHCHSLHPWRSQSTKYYFSLVPAYMRHDPRNWARTEDHWLLLLQHCGRLSDNRY